MTDAMSDATTIDAGPVSVTPVRTPLMLIAETTTATERQLIDFFSRLSTRQREALYAMHGKKQLEKIHNRWHAPGHRPFVGNIITCLCDAGLAKIAIFRHGGRSMMSVMLTPAGKKLMKAVDALDAVFAQNLFEIGAGT